MAIQGLPPDGGMTIGWRNWFDLVVRKTLDRLNSHVLNGVGSPAGVVAAPVGTLYLNDSGGAGSTLWLKESGGTTTAGWVAK